MNCVWWIDALMHCVESVHLIPARASWSLRLDLGFYKTLECTLAGGRVATREALSKQCAFHKPPPKKNQTNKQTKRSSVSGLCVYCLRATRLHFKFLKFLIFVGVKQCPIAAKIVGSIGILFPFSHRDMNVSEISEASLSHYVYGKFGLVPITG